MKNSRKYILLAAVAIVFASACSGHKSEIGLTLIPPGVITDKVDLDVRAGIVNTGSDDAEYRISLYANDGKGDSLFHSSSLCIAAGESGVVKCILPAGSLSGGGNTIVCEVISDGKKWRKEKSVKVIESEIRASGLISGAWAGIYHWSEEEGKHWNAAIRNLTDDQWREMVGSMHKIGMDLIVIQEVFRNNDYVGSHGTTVENYQGRAFYPSRLYPGRMPVASRDAVEAILSEADKLGMDVLLGVGMFAWFDFTAESLEWHKNVVSELWDRYGKHESLYGFYVSEECAGNLYNSEQSDSMKVVRKREIADFFREFKSYVSKFAPDKPVMLATNSMGVLDGADGYPALLENLDILCPFGFARMPEGDLSGKEAAELLQKFCDNAGAHLWFDLEAFLFNPDMSLYPRPIEEIIHDLNLLDNFEKVLCYQYPGVFSDPDMSVRVGEERTETLFKEYKEYMDSRNIDNN